ncbi:MAG TPA: hypothetical protein PKB03_00075 [Baekduia sp.]|nr:hypothetical protein [Baekduia sp.]
MSATEQIVALVCPSCGSDRLGHLETVTVRYRVKATFSLKSGRDYEYDDQYDSERFDESATVHEIAPFECLDCDSQHELEELDVPDSITGQIDGWS